MALSRATPLLTTAGEVTDLTGVQDLANLESGAEFSVADHLLRAHEWVFDHVEQAHGASAPALISNTTRLERAVAARFLEVLYATAQIGAGDTEARDYWQAAALDEVRRFRPVYSDSSDAPRSSAEGIPVVGRFEKGWRFAGGGNDRYRVGFPSRRT